MKRLAGLGKQRAMPSCYPQSEPIAKVLCRFISIEPARLNRPEIEPPLAARPIGREIELRTVTAQARRHIASRRLRVVQALERLGLAPDCRCVCPRDAEGAPTHLAKGTFR